MIFFSIGLKMYRNPAAPNSYLAYRTHFSRKNDETWFAANCFAGLLLMIMAVILLGMLAFMESTFDDQYVLMRLILYYFLSCSFLIYYLTERRLKRFFHRDGKRRASSL